MYRILIFFFSVFLFASGLQAQSTSENDTKLLNALKSAKEDTAKVNILNSLSESHYNKSLQKSMSFAQNALELSQKLRYEEGEKNAYNILRRVNRRLGNFEAAIRYTLNTLPLAEKLNDSTEMFNCYSALGNIYSGLDKPDEAKKYLKMALAMGKLINSPALSSTFNFLGRMYGISKNYDSAFYFILKALEIERTKPQANYTLSYIYNNLAEVYQETSKYNEAEKYYLLSANLPDERKSPLGMTFTLIGLSKIYKAQNKLDQSVSILEEALDLSKRNSYRDKTKEILGLLFQIFEEKHDFQKALYYYKQFNLYQDSVFSEEKIKTIEDLKINYETQKIEHENELLRKNAELNDAELNQRFILGWTSVFGILALLVVIFLLYRNNTQRTKTNLLLNQYNRDLAEQVFKRTLDLVNSNQELVKQNNQLEQFGYIIAHNLRAPVARILGLTNIISSSSFSLPADNMILEKLSYTSKELDTVIHDLNAILDVKKGVNNTLETINLNQRLDKVKSILKDKIKESNAIVHADFSEGDECFAIPAYIESILYNIISNAIKYKADDRDPLIDVSTNKDATMICITIEDNGIGIDLDTQGDKLFNLYQRFHYHVEGKGMGLFLVKSQVEAMSGKIEVESEVNVGTTFKIYLPLNPLT